MPKQVEIEHEFDSYLWTLYLLKCASLLVGKSFFYQVNYKYVRGFLLELKLVDLLDKNRVVFTGIIFPSQFDSIMDSEKLNKNLEEFAKKWRKETFIILKSLRKEKTKIFSPSGLNLLKISGFFYSLKTQKEVFELVVSDWQAEYFEALFKKEIWKARWINVRYTYAFLAAMWAKSPIGDLIEFVSKLAK